MAVALLLYDVLLTSGQEYQYIWREPKAWVSRVLYMWNRYMSFLYNILQLGTIHRISDTVSVNYSLFVHRFEVKIVRLQRFMLLLEHCLHVYSDVRPA